MNRKTTTDRILESMTPKQRQKHDEEYHDLLLSELLIALTSDNDLSVRKLAKEAGVSPRVIQAMRSGENKDYSLKNFFKILHGLHCKKITITTQQGKNINIPLITNTKKSKN